MNYCCMCGKEIPEEQSLCCECYNILNESNDYDIVTREMALDAECPSLQNDGN